MKIFFCQMASHTANAVKALPASQLLSAGAVALLLSAPTFAADKLSLQAAKAGDQMPGQLRPAITAPWQNDSRDSVSVSYALDMDTPLALDSKPEALESREYWRKVTGAELSKGVALPTTAPGALLRISGLDNGNQSAKSAMITDSENLMLRNPRGIEQTLSSSSRALYQAAKDQPAQLPFGRGTIAAKLDKELGAGLFVLQTKQALASDTEYLVQVFEPESPYRLQAKHGSHNVLAGNRLNADGALWRDNQTVSAKSVSAVLLAPDGRRMPLTVSRGRNQHWQIAQVLDAPTGDVPGLWEVEWTLKTEDNGVAIERQLRTAFAFAAASARWEKGVQISQSTTAVSLQVPVTVASAGRYELRAVVSGKDSAGLVRPVAFAATANWLESGRAPLTLSIDKSVLNDAGVSGALFIQDLQLIDQSRMAVLQRQAHALQLSERQWRGASTPSRERDLR